MSNETTVLEWAKNIGATDVRAAAAIIGVELRGDDGQPFHCGVRMTVKSGIFGVDYAKCEGCGCLLMRIDSPHTNGGRVFEDADYDALGENVWVARNNEQ